MIAAPVDMAIALTLEQAGCRLPPNHFTFASGLNVVVVVIGAFCADMLCKKFIDVNNPRKIKQPDSPDCWPCLSAFYSKAGHTSHARRSSVGARHEMIMALSLRLTAATLGAFMTLTATKKSLPVCHNLRVFQHSRIISV